MYDKDKFIKNGTKEFIGGVDPIKAENWIIWRLILEPSKCLIETRLGWLLLCFRRRLTISGS